MQVVSLELKQFRCFTSYTLNFEGPVTLITGPNGTGKTSILEALHYACHLRSFKTHIPKELIQFAKDGFALQLQFTDGGYTHDTMGVSFVHNKRTIKINQKAVNSYKELYSLYKAITVTEDDLELIKGAPSLRRVFVDSAIAMIDPTYAQLLRSYKMVLDNRNALLSYPKNSSSASFTESYHLWTDQLLKLSQEIQHKRRDYLALLQNPLAELMESVMGTGASLELKYNQSRSYDTYSTTDAFLEEQSSLLTLESAQRRSLFGSHLDDIAISFQEKASRTYASRGQQKLILFLLKIAQLKLLSSHEGKSNLFLIDDFMADFDDERASKLLSLISTYAQQIIITSPVYEGVLKQTLLGLDAQRVHLANPLDK